MFYAKLFRLKVFNAAFMCLQFGFVILWQKEIGAKAARKMLAKLTGSWQAAYSSLLRFHEEKSATRRVRLKNYNTKCNTSIAATF